MFFEPNAQKNCTMTIWHYTVLNLVPRPPQAFNRGFEFKAAIKKPGESCKRRYTVLTSNYTMSN